MQTLEQEFELISDHRLTLIFGSTGKHYAQIINGAPFDAFFAADIERPQRLEIEGFAVEASRFTYAIGKLVLWSPRPDYVDAQGGVLENGNFRHLAIANPRLAPYGLAAREVLQGRGVWDQINSRLVRGENIAQTFQFVDSGNAELGFVAMAQLSQPGLPFSGSAWQVPQTLYQPIEQQAVLLNDNVATQDLAGFMKSPQGKKIIIEHGYDVP